MNIRVWKNIVKTLLVVTLVSSIQVSGLNANTNKQEIVKPKQSKVVTAAKVAGSGIKFIYSNSGCLLSKNTLATAMILGAPYIYLSDTDILANIATLMSDMTFKISDAAMSGMLKAAYNNKAIVSRLSSIFAAKFIAAEAAKTGVSTAMKYGFAALGYGIRGYFGWSSYNNLVNDVVAQVANK